MATHLHDPLPAIFAQKKYSSKGTLGSGAQATVYAGHNRQTNSDVAIKVVNTTSRKDQRALRSEFQITQELNHPCVISAVELLEVEGTCCAVFEMADSGDLFDQLEPNTGNNLALPYDEASIYLADTAEALAHTHACGYVHRDIKPENILIHKRRALLCDFGMATPRASRVSGKMPGTSSYMAPEVIEAESSPDIFIVTPAIDVWSFGIVFYAILFADLPWEQADLYDPEYVQFLRDEGVQPHIYPFSLLEYDVCRMLGRMLAHDPQDRCTMKEVAEFLRTPRPWFVPKNQLCTSKRLDDHNAQLATEFTGSNDSVDSRVVVVEEGSRTSMFTASTASLDALDHIDRFSNLKI